MRLPKVKTMVNRQENLRSTIDMDELRFYAAMKTPGHSETEDMRNWKRCSENITKEIKRINAAYDKHMDDLEKLQNEIESKWWLARNKKKA